jgi:hypothetical protein
VFEKQAAVQVTDLAELRLRLGRALLLGLGKAFEEKQGEEIGVKLVLALAGLEFVCEVRLVAAAT